MIRTAGRALGALLSGRKGAIAIGGGASFGLYQATHADNLKQYYTSRYGEEEGGRAAEGVGRLGTAAAAGVGLGAVAHMIGKRNAVTGTFMLGAVGIYGAYKGAKGVLKIGKKFLTSPFMAGKHPYYAGAFYGTAGMAGVIASQSRRNINPNAPEGRITGVYSGPGGGLYAPLQFSTQGLPQRIHGSRRRARL